MNEWAQMDPKDIVRDGYDVIGDDYEAWVTTARSEERERYTEVLLNGLPDGARVLDLGCGTGLPTTRRLAARFQVTGVDISPRQIERARDRVPLAEFFCVDVAQLDWPADSVDGVAAFYSLIHMPREEQAALIQRVFHWLKPGAVRGHLLDESGGRRLWGRLFPQRCTGAAMARRPTAVWSVGQDSRSSAIARRQRWSLVA